MVRVEFVMDEFALDASLDSLMVDVCRDAGSSVPFGCRNGVCGTCITKVVSGKDNLSSMDSRERQTLELFGALDGDHRLMCRCRLLGDVTLDNP